MKQVQRAAAVVTIVGLAVGALSVTGLAVAAFAGAEIPTVPRAPITSARAVASAAPAPAPTVTPAPTPTPSMPSAVAATDWRTPGTGVDAASYTPYLDPASPEYVTPAARSEYMGREEVIRACMHAAGFDYLLRGWWLGGSPQPTGLDFETSILWLKALYGPGHPVVLGGGCADEGIAAEEAARAAGTPLSGPVPEDPHGEPTERETWLAFQQIVRDCMADAGHEYLYFEWWNPRHRAAVDPLADPNQPEHLDETQRAAWRLALDGDAGTGAAYRWQDAGCYGYAVHVSGNDNMR